MKSLRNPHETQIWQHSRGRILPTLPLGNNSFAVAKTHFFRNVVFTSTVSGPPGYLCVLDHYGYIPMYRCKEIFAWIYYMSWFGCYIHLQYISKYIIFSRYALQVTLHIHFHICSWHFLCTHTYKYVLYIFLVCNFFYKIWFSPVICLRIRMCEFCLWSTACFIGCSLSYSQNFINSFIHPYKHV